VHLLSRTGADILKPFTVDDTDSFLTSDVGGPIQDDISLKAGERGPTLLEDFVFRQKIQHFDHERVSYSWPELNSAPLLIIKVPERAVHARGAGKNYLSA